MLVFRSPIPKIQTFFVEKALGLPDEISSEILQVAKYSPIFLPPSLCQANIPHSEILICDVLDLDRGPAATKNIIHTWQIDMESGVILESRGWDCCPPLPGRKQGSRLGFLRANKKIYNLAIETIEKRSVHKITVVDRHSCRDYKVKIRCGLFDDGGRNQARLGRIRKLKMRIMA
jgi:hypothetical protein